MTQADVELRFIKWNVMGVDGDRLTSGNWSFRGSVLFYQYRPQKRFIKDKLGRPVMLRRQYATSDSVSTKPIERSMGDVKYLEWTLPDIGVWSWYEGDMLSQGELHERMQFLFMAELRCYADTVLKPMSGADLGAKGQAAVVKHVDAMYERYDAYNQLFAQHWAPMPEMYRTEIIELMNAKVKRYHDPKQVAARDRMHARKIAKKAFGIAS